MIKYLRAAGLAFLLACAPVAARADSFDTTLWTLGGIQVVDALQTQSFLHGGRFECNAIGKSIFQPGGPPATGVCVAIEADPLARPFVGNLGRNVGASLLINGVIQGVARILFKHSHKDAAKVLWVVNGVYAGGVLAPNQRIIQAQADFRNANP